MKNIIKYGKTKHGVQIYLNKETNIRFIEEADRRSIPLETKMLAIKMVVDEGIPFRKVGRLLGVDHVSVMNWVYKASEEVKMVNLNIDNASVKEVQVDEIYAIINKKKNEPITTTFL
jgi:transposase-like protein